MDDFKEAPVSIGEIKADRSKQAKDWSVRDLLISLLRQIDAGEIEPLKAVLVYSIKPKEQGKTDTIKTLCAKIDQDYEALGLLATANLIISNP